MKREALKFFAFLFSLTQLISCSYNPFVRNNHLTGSPVAAAIGAGAGAGTVAALDGPKPLIPVVGIGGGMLGYYLTTLRHDAGGIIRGGGKVYKVGDYVGIYIPSDRLFEPNTDELLPRAMPILHSVKEVLERYPRNSIIISGNTSGFFRSTWEQKLSERRARKVSSFLWNVGINNFIRPGNGTRDLTYVGYADYFPISQSITNNGIRANSRIQIVSYPGHCDLNPTQKQFVFNNPAAWEEPTGNVAPCDDCEQIDP